jgi:iron complex outermembrane receptor protein
VRSRALHRIATADARSTASLALAACAHRAARGALTTFLAVAASCYAAVPARASNGASPSARDLSDLSIEELMNVELVSAMRTEEPLWKTPAAVHVLTNEDLRRSGAKNIPDALRMVPGLDVASLNGTIWAVSARGFNSALANKLLVMIDGRSVYSPLFSNVYWDEHNVLFEDIDRIEVLRGPGGTLWGANAVNGVVNIVTKSAAQTEGGFAEVALGNEQRAAVGLRYGNRVGGRASYRVTGQFAGQEAFADRDGADSFDALETAWGGIRVDWSDSQRDEVALDARIYHHVANQTTTVPSIDAPYSRAYDDESPLRGGHALVSWKRTFSADSRMLLRMFADVASREERLAPIDRSNIEVDLQHELSTRGGHGLIWGFGARYVHDEVDAQPWLSFANRSRGDAVLDAFAQTQVALVQERLWTIFGTKLDVWNDRVEALPSARLLWTPSPARTLWASVAKASRRPSWADLGIRYDLDVITPAGGEPVLRRVLGSPDFEPERLIAYETGVRVRPIPRLTADLAVFYDDHGSLQTFQQDGPTVMEGSPAYAVANLVARNNGNASAAGAEIAAQVDVTSAWKLNAGYSYLDLDIDLARKAGLETVSLYRNGQAPQHQAHLRSYWDVTHDVQLDLALYAVDDLPLYRVPSYARVDARVGWNPIPEIGLDLVGQNLLDERHAEFGDFTYYRASESERRVFASAAYRF